MKTIRYYKRKRIKEDTFKLILKENFSLLRPSAKKKGGEGMENTNHLSDL